MKHCNGTIIFLFLFITHAAFSQVIPASRKTDWSLAGYSGTIPLYTNTVNVMDFGASANGSTSNDLALQNAINSLNNGEGIIHFPAGIFLFNAPITLRSGLVLKGAGAGNTVLRFNLAGNGNLITIAGTVSDDSAAITASVFKDATRFTCSNAALFHVNDVIKIYQNDAALINDSWAQGSVAQLVRINAINGDTIYFANPLRRNYRLADAPGIRKINMVTGAGIECLTIKRLDATIAQTANLLFLNAINCWVKGVESDSCNFAHVQLANSANIEITNSYFHGAFGYGAGGQGYGISCEYSSGECLIENNIFRHLRHSMLVQSGANGNVFDYNYSIEPFKTDSLPFDLSGDIVLHGNYPYLNLFEGNIVQNIIMDASHSINGPFNTFFRNRAAAYGMFISPGAGDSCNIVGNEISGTGFQKGNYVLYGNGHLQYGNNKNDTIIPPGTIALAERSLIYHNSPAWWNISGRWPTIGIGNSIGTGNIPAKERISNAPVFCLSPQPVIYTFTGNGNWTLAANWSNDLIPPSVLADGSEIIIDPLAGGKAVLNIPYVLNPGGSLKIMPGKQFEVGANLIFVH
jgi:hypothetical protein